LVWIGLAVERGSVGRAPIERRLILLGIVVIQLSIRAGWEWLRVTEAGRLRWYVLVMGCDWTTKDRLVSLVAFVWESMAYWVVHRGR
jgi:hypothetical protein